jgi:NAD(P)H dehydrogenase (quinone)
MLILDGFRRLSPVLRSPARILAIQLLVLLSALVAFSPVQADSLSADERLIVSGASGRLGGLTVEALLTRGVPAEQLILVSRSPDSLQRYAALGASVRFGDFTQPDSLPDAYAGGTRMLLISIGAASLPRVEAHRNAIEAAVGAGVRHIAYTSFVAISAGDSGGMSDDHATTEQILRDSGVAWTMLRNSLYMDGVVQQAAGMVASGRAAVPDNATRIAYVTREDCAEAAAAVLATSGHENRVYDITGPGLVGPAEIAEAASAVTGVTIERVSGGGGGRGMGGPGLDIVSDHVETLTGRPATSVQQFLEANRDRLQ